MACPKSLRKASLRALSYPTFLPLPTIWLNIWTFGSRTDSTSSPHHNVKNTVDLVDKIKNEKPPPLSSRFVSSNVVGSFPHIPKALTFQFLGELLVKANIPHQEITEFFDLFNLCWTPNYCKFKNQFYEFPDEVRIAIGSQLGSLISKIFMFKFEKALLSSSHPSLTLVTYWCRYVDDVLCL